MGSIYLIRNNINGKCYIGKTKHDAERGRIPQHLNGRGNLLIKKAIAKYGKNAFSYEILYDGIIPELLDSLEINAIKKHNCKVPNGYNLTDGGEGLRNPSLETRQKISVANKGKPSWQKGKPSPMKGIPRSEETRQKISIANKGRVFSEEHRQKLSASNKGRSSWNKGKPSPMKGIPRSEETRQKISIAKKGRTFSEEHRQKLSVANKGKTLSEDTRRKID